ncbi:MAG: hypothetical protein HY699_06250 [Deltaproteobacteria bacterium]|nr:hypothetical protein [Deltaproteobacteria bacterium]
MSALRLLRVAAIAGGLPMLFNLSRLVAAARGDEPVPGIAWALAVVSLLFSVRAVVTEYSRGPEANLQKDLLWGLALGGWLTIVAQLW